MKQRFASFTVHVANIVRSIRRIKNEEMAEFNLRSSHTSCLYYLHDAGPITATKLCDLCGEDKANVSRALAFLEEEGYITYSSKSAKRYQSKIKLTERGQEIAARIAEKIDRYFVDADTWLTEEERNTLYTSLELIDKRLTDICDGYN